MWFKKLCVLSQSAVAQYYNLLRLACKLNHSLSREKISFQRTNTVLVLVLLLYNGYRNQ